jgi:hypothetical protein
MFRQFNFYIFNDELYLLSRQSRKGATEPVFLLRLGTLKAVPMPQKKHRLERPGI